jgi:hypothetical protein
VIQEAIGDAARECGLDEIERIDAADAGTQDLVQVSAQCGKKIGQ